MTIGEGASGSREDLSRREFLSASGVGLSALGVTRTGWRDLLSDRSKTNEPTSNAGAVIHLMLVGGPSQLETFDPKPDAPAEARGPFRSIATRVPGIRICEHLPRLAARMDRLAIVRSMHHTAAPIHETGYQLLQTGRLFRNDDEQPHLGYVASHLLGSRNEASPFVILPGLIKNTGVQLPHGQTSGWLADATDARCRQPMLRDEPLTIRERYGLNPFGQSCLKARRLVEAGTRMVTVNMFDTVFDEVSWDCHGGSPFSTFDDYAKTLLPRFDRAVTALLDDLERTGLLATTLVVATGEFGRTPRINASGGRDHWPGVWSALVAGGGVRGGQVIGASDAHAAEVADRPVSPQELLATMYRRLGIDPETSSLQTPSGEPYSLTNGAKPIGELFS